MQNLLLTTKLFFPPSRSELVRRPRLIERLQQGLKGPLTLISAPAGFGKTTLISEWHSGLGSRFPVAWLSLSADDNDPARFLQYLIAALGNLQQGMGDEIQPLLQTSEPPNIGAVLTLLINQLSKLNQDAVLVLDDFHWIELPDINNLLIFLLEHLPPRLHLVMLTRADPALPLARLRAHGQLTEIRAEHLRFGVEECRQFLNQIMGLNLTLEHINALEKRTEGWAAGLQLAALSMQGNDDLDGFISAFTGNNHYIVDYLAEEVLNRQPESLREFLLKTSILARLTGPLCNALTGGENGSGILAGLNRANLFVVPLDNNQTWFRYHPLFADLLHSRLHHSYPKIINELHVKASAWFEKNGLMEEAVSHALAAEDFERAALLLDQFGPNILRQGRVATLSRWIKALPETIISQKPSLGFSLAWALYIEHKYDQAQEWIRQIEHNLSPSNEPAHRGEIALWHGIIARRNAEYDQSRHFLQQALEVLPAENSVLRARAWVFLGLYYLETDIRKAKDAFFHAASLADSENNTEILVILYFLSWIQVLQGELNQASSTTKQALQIAEKMHHWPVTGYAYLATGELFCERNELVTAEEHMEKAAELARLGGHTDNLMMAILDACKIQRANGNWTKAQTLISEVWELAKPSVFWFKVQVLNEQICLFLTQGQVDAAAGFLKQIQDDSQKRSAIPKIQEAIIQTRVRVALNDKRGILKELEALAEQVKNMGLKRWMVQILCQQALVFDKLGRKKESIEKLRSALEIAEQENAIQPFLDEGNGILSLLRLMRKEGLATEFIARLLAAFDGQLHGKNISQPKSEILSKREIELLGLIAEGRSNKEIANELVISIATVKRHTVNIFNKLDVKNRTEAVARGRELKLLKFPPL